MELQNDFKELLESFNARKVKYLIVGGYAVAFHGAPRATGDIDIYVEPTKANSRRVIEALNDFGFGSLGLKAEDFQKPDMVVQLGIPPVRVDIVTEITGVTWKDGWAGRVSGTYGPVPVQFLGREQLIQNKRATGRQKDLADLESLGE